MKGTTKVYATRFTESESSDAEQARRKISTIKVTGRKPSEMELAALTCWQFAATGFQFIKFRTLQSKAL